MCIFGVDTHSLRKSSQQNIVVGRFGFLGLFLKIQEKKQKIQSFRWF